MYFRVNKYEGQDNEDGEYIQLRFKDRKTWALAYHCAAAFFIGWPAHWLTKWAKKHSTWIHTEYNIEVFKKRLDGHENL